MRSGISVRAGRGGGRGEPDSGRRGGTPRGGPRVDRQALSAGRKRGPTEASLAGPRATARVLLWLPAVGALLGVVLGVDPVATALGGGVGTAGLLAGGVRSWWVAGGRGVWSRGPGRRGRARRERRLAAQAASSCGFLVAASPKPSRGRVSGLGSMTSWPSRRLPAGRRRRARAGRDRCPARAAHGLRSARGRASRVLSRRWVRPSEGPTAVPSTAPGRRSCSGPGGPRRGRGRRRGWTWCARHWPRPGGRGQRRESLRVAGEQLRRDQQAAARQAAARLAVHLVLPLGVCFLPAFVLIGLLPVLLSLGGGVLGGG